MLIIFLNIKGIMIVELLATLYSEVTTVSNNKLARQRQSIRVAGNINYTDLKLKLGRMHHKITAIPMHRYQINY
jgi:hypothetical protein